MTIAHDLSLAGLSIRQVIALHGLERLRGQPIKDGSCVLYIADRDLDAAIQLWEDEPDGAVRQRRFYGSVVRNDPFFCSWIYASSPVATAEQVEAAHTAEEGMIAPPISADKTTVPHADLIRAALKGKTVAWFDVARNEWSAYQTPREAIHALTLLPGRRVQLVQGQESSGQVPLNLFVHADTIHAALEGKLVQWFDESQERWETYPTSHYAVLCMAAFPERHVRAPGSWVIRNSITGDVIMETFNPAIVRKLNTSKYEAVAIQDYLAGVNRAIRERGR